MAEKKVQIPLSDPSLCLPHTFEGGAEEVFSFNTPDVGLN